MTSPQDLSSPKPIILFDGVCNLCAWSVQFIIKRDPQAHFQFTSLQSPVGQSLLGKFHLSQQNFDSFILVDGSGWYAESDAALRVVRKLSGVWPLLYGFVLVPRPIRNWGYQFIARNRYRWFGQSDSCLMPTPALTSRFVPASGQQSDGNAPQSASS
jgi:predicted DCC family thiol-disulfide oxidoreductase YuxK